jgi:ribosomal protein S18 acetylase RimI-like enzyme
VRIRYFALSDLRSVFDLACTALKERYTPTLFINLQSYWPEGFIVVEDLGTVHGFILGVTMSRIQARILMLAVSDIFRRKGYATLLFRQFCMECAKKGIRYLTLEVRKSNLPAMLFYEKMGFQITGEIERYYTDGEDACEMHIFL